MFKKKLFTFSILFFSNILNAQSDQNWKTFTSTNSVTDIDFENETWFASTTGGIATQKNEGEIKTLSKNDGFNELNFSAISISKNQKVWIGLKQSGKIKVWDVQNEKLESFSDFSGSQIIKIDAKSDTVLIATLNQIHLASASELKIKESIQNFGSVGIEPTINTFLKDGTRILVGTEKGLTVSDLQVSNIQDPDNWAFVNLGMTATEKNIFGIAKNENFYFVKTEQQFQKISFNLILTTPLTVSQLTKTELPFPTGTFYSLQTLNSKLYACTSDGVFVLNGNVWEIFGTGIEQPVKLTVKSNGTFVAGTKEKGFFTLAEGSATWEKIELNIPESNFFDQIAVDSKGKLFVVTGRAIDKPSYNGLMTFDGTTWKHYNTQNTPEIKANNHFVIFADSKDNVWLGNPGKGAVKIKQNNENLEFTHFYTNVLKGAFLPSGDTTFVVVQGIIEDPQGNIWLSNKSVGEANDVVVVVKNDDSVTKIGGFKIDADPTGSLTGIYTNQVEEIRFDFQGDAWFTAFHKDIDYPIVQGTFKNTLNDQSDDVYSIIDRSNGLENSKVIDFEIDENGDAWAGTPNGAYKMNTSVSSSVVERIYGLAGNRILSDNITCVEVDPTGKVWFGTDSGISVLNPSTYDFVQNFTVTNSPLLENYIRDIKFFTPEGEDTKVFIATYSGLMIYSTGEFPPGETIKNVNVFPNPARLPKDSQIKIGPVVSNSQVKIFTSSGRLVKSLKSQSGQANVVWDGTDKEGKLVSSGVYVVILYDNGFGESSAVSKVAIIRE
ncbi:T9SS type A sorting domain-containing protein [bacterium]|nr:T9SS type A sorting domain-containing protein [bacterium]